MGLPLVSLLAFFLAFRGRTYPQVSVCQKPLWGKNQNEVQAFLEKNLIGESVPNIILSYQDFHYPLDLSSLHYQPKVTTQKVLQAGRDKSLLLSLKKLFLLILEGQNFALDFQVDQDQLISQLNLLADKLYLPPINPEIKISKENNQKIVLVEKGQNGQEVETQKLKEKIVQAIACPKKEITLDIPIVITSPTIPSETVNITQQRANSLIGKQIKLKLNEQEWLVNDEEIINFLSFTGGFDKNKITEFAKNLAQTINRPAEDAAFQFENNKVTVFRPSREGIELAHEEFVNNFEKKLLSLEEEKEIEEMEIPVKKIQPKITTADANSLGIKELLGQGKSSFSGSSNERIHNIDLASLRLHGILIAPGEEFSFNKALGEVSTVTGYKQAYIIKEGRTVLGDGGGVCQVSTTLFRAALNAGLPILERHAHAYRVSYYEIDSEPGLDATVFSPTADLKFKNNTPAYLLIQRQINLKTKKLIFEIYGTRDNRQVKISKVRIWDKVPPPPDLYQDDPTLPVGTVKQVDWKAWGAKAAFDYLVVRNGETLEKKTFYSYYKPWRAVYLRGTKQ